MKSNTSIIFEREYLERVRKKSFIITTLLMPLLMVVLGATPTLIMIFSSPEDQHYNVIDADGSVVSRMMLDSTSTDIRFTALNIPVEEALKDMSADGLIVIPAGITDTVPSSELIRIYTADGLSMQTEQELTSAINHAVETERLKRYNIHGLDNILKNVESNVSVQNIRTDREDETASSSIFSFILGEFLTFLLYIALLLYGQMVMTSIIEEKNNRVLEVMVSSVKPTQLLLGKIAGIGAVAVTQIVIWMVLMGAISAFVIPALLPPDLMSQVSALSSGSLDLADAAADADLLQAMSMLTNPMYILSMFVWLLLFLVGGFLLYAGVFAAIGSAVDNIQDASQLQSVVVIPIVLGIIFGMQAASMPNSTLALITSFVPFTAPMVMLARIPFDIPSWQIWISLAVLFLSVVGMVWVAAKIYRVGIFMYGKKPTLKELIRWTRYK